ncbi:MAG: YggS family pyridoxal phosphate-dependent enzyme [Bacillota bacterium]|nr:YggS family pyridoxal phosphate-dependent enzyme [Bacillota bacterium]
MIDVKKNLEDIVQRIEKAKERAGRTDQVHLLAVTKTIDYDLIDQSIDWGVSHVGENKVQDILKRMDHYGDRLKYHFIGSLQRNKVKDIVGKVELIHSVDSLRLAKEIDKRAKNADLIQPCLLQVNVSKEESKSGVYLEELEEFVYNVLKLDNIKIRGFMTMAPFDASEEELRKYFGSLRDAFNKYNKEVPGLEMEYLSMGMTHDFEIAIEEGANIVRVGSGIYGERNY